MKQLILIIIIACTCAYARAQEPVIESATDTITVKISEYEGLQARIIELENNLSRKILQLNQTEMKRLEYELFFRRLVVAMAQIEQSKELETIINFVKQIKNAILDVLERKS